MQRYPRHVEKSIEPRRTAMRGPPVTKSAGVDALRRFPVGCSPVRCVRWPRARVAYRERVVSTTNVLHETDIQTPESQEKEHPRLPRPNEHPGGPQDAVPAEEKGTSPAGGGGRLQVAGAPDSGAVAAMNVRLPPARRIRRGGDIRNLLRRGKRRRTSECDVFLAASAASRARFGVIVPKHGHTIVRRNQLMRRLREIGRLDVLPRLDTLPAGLDFLVRAKRGAYGVSYQRLRDQLVMLTEERL